MVDERGALILQGKTGYPSIDKRHLWNTKFSLKHPAVSKLSIANHLDFLWHNSKGDIAIYENGRFITRGEVLDNSKTIAKAFLELGVYRDNVIFMSLPNSHQALECFLAANRIGASIMLVDQDDTLRLIDQLVGHKPKLYINFNQDKEFSKAIIHNTETKVITLNSMDEDLEDSDIDNIDDNLINYRDLKVIGDRNNSILNPVNLGDACALIDPNKSYYYRNSNIQYTCKYINNSVDIKENNKCLSYLPKLTTQGFIASVLAPVIAGKEMIISDGITDEDLIVKPDLIMTDADAIPELYNNIVETKDLSFVKKIISRSSDTDELSYFSIPLAKVEKISLFGKNVLLGIKRNVDEESKTKLVNGPKFVILNEYTNEEVKYDEVGRLCVRGKHVMNDNSRTVRFNDDDYYKTDIKGSIDREGNFVIAEIDEKVKRKER